MIKRLTVGLAIAAFATALGGTASASTQRPAPAEWKVTSSSTLDCDMTHDCHSLTANVWDW